MPGVVQFIGEIESLGHGMWIGVLHDEPVGTSNGVIDGRRLFACPKKHGGFYKGQEVTVEKHAEIAPVTARGTGSPPTVPISPPPAPVAGGGASLSENAAVAATSVAAGRGLHTAVVAQLSQVTITCFDAHGRRCTTGGDGVSVIVRGLSPPTKLRVKLHDHGDGIYVAEYRAELSGQLLIHVAIRGEPLPGSPFCVEALTLRPDPLKCSLRGAALTSAIARKPTAFEIDFVDALGNPAVAEELDVRLERVDALPAEAQKEFDDDESAEDPAEEKAAMEERLATVGKLRICLAKAAGLAAADLNGKSDPYVSFTCAEHKVVSTVKAKTLSPVWNETYEMEDALQKFLVNGLMIKVFDCDNPQKPEKDDMLAQKQVSLEGLRRENASQFEAEVLFDASGKNPAGKIFFELRWEPPANPEDEEVETHTPLVVGDERVVIGMRPLILRESFDKRSPILTSILPGTRVQMHETREMAEGRRVRVRVMSLPGAPPLLEKIYGWITAVHFDGRKRLAKRHLKLDAFERRRQVDLWSKRLSDDKALLGIQAMLNSKEASASGLEGKDKEGKVGPSFAHELTECQHNIAFAYGGLFPGTLHAHGALIKTHQVSYSVGAAGKYLMHVGLRQQSVVLPGSPFLLQVKPGLAHAPSTRLPEGVLPLETVVGTEGRLVIQMCDCMGNRCVDGGAPLEVTIQGQQAAKQADTSGQPAGGDATNAPLTCKCIDQQDGTFLVSWTGKVSKNYMLELRMNHAHLVGSPVPLKMVPAELDIGRCELLAPREAIAGIASQISVTCRDAYGNEVSPQTDGSGAPPFGLVLLPLANKEKIQSGPSKDNGASSLKKEEKGGADEKRRASLLKKEERANLVKTLESIPFQTSWDKSNVQMSFIPKEAGDFELHVWCEPDGKGTRHFLPGSPMVLKVQAGRASATGSIIKDVGSLAQLIAGDKLMIKVQICDEFNNFASLSAPGDMVAILETPVGHVTLIKKTDDKSKSAEQSESKKKSSVAVANSAIGLYEIMSPSELTVKGSHKVSIELNGTSVTGSPIKFNVAPGQPSVSKSYMEAKNSRLEVDSPIDIVLRLLDKHGNQCERGGVRVDAKVFGSKASEAKVVDHANGIITITFTASLPGDYKCQCRLENADMPVLLLHVGEVHQKGSTRPDDDVEMGVEMGASPLSTAPLMPPRSTGGGAASTEVEAPTKRGKKSKKKEGKGKTSRPPTPKDEGAFLALAPTASAPDASELVAAKSPIKTARSPSSGSGAAGSGKGTKTSRV